MNEQNIFLGTGSNLGDRAGNLEKACRLIAAHIGPVRAASRLYHTKAWGVSEQPDYFNQVLCVSTELEPETVLDTILDIERQMGRVRRIKWGPRLIDIDILFYGDRVIRTDRLVIPHPFLQDRRFVLVPLAEIAPDLEHPLLKKSVTELLSACPDDLAVAVVPLTAHNG